MPPGWEFGCHVTAVGPGLRYELVTELVWVGSMLGSMSGRQNRSLERVEVGWPIGAMEWVGGMDYRVLSGPGTPAKVTPGAATAWTWAAGLEPPFRKGAMFQGANRRLALVPLWPGFALQTGVWAAVVWLGMTGWRAGRRAARRRRGQCPSCAYPAGTSERCSECGALAGARTTRPGLAG